MSDSLPPPAPDDAPIPPPAEGAPDAAPAASTPAGPPPPQKLTTTHWLILAMASIGFAFDIYELLMLPLVVRPALLELVGATPGSPEFQMCEFVAAVAWLAELFPNPEQREKTLGYSQAFSSVGGLLVAIVNGALIASAASFPAIVVPEFLTGLIGSIGPAHQHEAWRYTLMSGLIPALPLIIIRPFLPESPVWAEKKRAGTLKRPSIAALFSPEFRRTTIVTTVMFACSYGAAFGAIQMIPQIVTGLADVQEAVKDKPVPQQRRYEQTIASEYVKLQEIGGLAGRFLLALLAVRILSRRKLLRVFQVP
ncbi:MAG: major facilitator superfamily protein, partial [bacterium]